jgi:uncharacterized membrane protein
MNKYSLTFAGVIGVLIGYILRYFGITASDEEVSTVVEAISALATTAGIILTWYGRYRQGDVNLLGVKKKKDSE